MYTDKNWFNAEFAENRWENSTIGQDGGETAPLAFAGKLLHNNTLS
jgi:hypothetical protein